LDPNLKPRFSHRYKDRRQIDGHYSGDRVRNENPHEPFELAPHLRVVAHHLCHSTGKSEKRNTPDYYH
jgi:hypothetical protein